MHNLLKRKMTISPRGATVDKTNLQPGEILHLYFKFYNVTSIRDFTTIITNPLRLQESNSQNRPLHPDKVK